MINKLDKLYLLSNKLKINDNTKIVIMSDCHRAGGDIHDNFLKNKNIFHHALEYYYNNNYTYLELGDGDEMWEVKKYEDIINAHINTFKLLQKFHNANRLIMIYGNHDIFKKKPEIVEKFLYKYHNKFTNQEDHLLNKLKVHESLILNYKQHDIFLIHGHQVDIFNSNLWIITHIFVRYIWRMLEKLGIKDPTKPIQNYKDSNRVEQKLKLWSKKHNKIIITGHTHRPVFPKIGEGLYFNDGSCIHPDGITCIEIEKGNITLVKWEYTFNRNNTFSIRKIPLEKTESIIKLYNYKE